MKALLYQGAENICYEDFADPDLKADTDVLVKMTACGICGSDLHIYQGHGFTEDMGYCVGHEAIGEVAEVGKGVNRYKPGDQVMLSAAVGCGNCRSCLAGNLSQCTSPGGIGCYGLSHSLEGCQAEGIVVPMGDFNLAHIPEGITPDQALMLTDNLPTAHLACKNADITPGKTVAVIGLGPIGLMAVEIAFAMGATQVYAIDLVEHRRNQAAALGAIPLSPDIARHKIEEDTKGQMLPCVVECVGADVTIDMAIKLAGRWGTVSAIGVNQSMDFNFPMALAFYKGLTFRIGTCSVQSHWEELIALIRGGRLHPEAFISHRMDLSEGAEAYRLFNKREDNALKMVMTP
ncbi:MAG: alcohol dehydrogenase catalytic domain-containing protein [Parvibaculaceae bacterium]|nr:alcohol dehydrogenase catalytic domain-containing protein [Parvibaculaceae bacterium]